MLREREREVMQVGKERRGKARGKSSMETLEEEEKMSLRANVALLSQFPVYNFSSQVFPR